MEDATGKGWLRETTPGTAIVSFPSEPTLLRQPGKEESSATPEVESSAAAPTYSHFTKGQKQLIVSIITFAATFSPLSSFIFFPAITALSQSLQVSVERINLTVTSYMIVSGIAPALMGDVADMAGRRIVFLLMFAIYLMANVGLAVQRSWIALFLLRMLQSAGGAANKADEKEATIAIGYGVVSDIAAPSERGGFVGALLLG
ncbi:MAG: hypothetical protein Q9207_008366 [Kuettlingeria erythrocarpa]